MKTYEEKPKRGLQIIKSVLSGFVAGIPILGDIKANIKSDLPVKGRFDWIRMISQIGTVITLILLMLNKVTPEQAKELMKIFLIN